MTTPAVKAIFVPGAWMGGWAWEPSADRLRDRGIDAEAITLKGLEPGESDADIAAVCLDDHVRHVVEQAEKDSSRPVVLISHSYSGMVTASAADRLGDQVIGLVHVGAFVATSGRSLLDDWGGSDEERAQERADIESAGNLWHGRKTSHRPPSPWCPTEVTTRHGRTLPSSPRRLRDGGAGTSSVGTGP